MIKITGLALIVLCCSTAGIWAASGLSKRVSTLEIVIRLYQYLRDSLKYLRPSVTMLIGRAAGEAEFSGLGFLRGCDEKMRSGKNFPESWREAISEDIATMGKEDAPIVLSLAGVLGASDLDSQLAALEHGMALLEARLGEAREYASKHKKLYRTLGVLAGLMVAIVIA